MSDLKDNFNIQVESAKLRAAEAGLSFGSYFQSFPVWKRRLLYTLLILLIPGFVLVRYGTEQAAALRLGRAALSAHPSFTEARAPVISEVHLLPILAGQYSAYVEVHNENLDLAAASIPYTFHFMDSAGREATTANGTIFLLPDQTKYVVVPRVDSAVGLSSASFELGEIKWQKKLSLPEVVLKTSEPFLSDETDPNRLNVEGSVVNNSPYQIGTIRLVFLVFNNQGKAIAVSQRDEFRVPPFGRRSYVQQWPGLFKTEVSKVEVIADTNTLDGNNIVVETTPSSDIRDLQPSNNGF